MRITNQIIPPLTQSRVLERLQTYHRHTDNSWYPSLKKTVYIRLYILNRNYKRVLKMKFEIMVIMATLYWAQNDIRNVKNNTQCCHYNNFKLCHSYWRTLENELIFCDKEEVKSWCRVTFNYWLQRWLFDWARWS